MQTGTGLLHTQTDTAHGHKMHMQTDTVHVNRHCTCKRAMHTQTDTAHAYFAQVKTHASDGNDVRLSKLWGIQQRRVRPKQVFA